MIEVVRLADVSWWRFTLAAALGVVAVVAGVALLGVSGYLICRAAEQPAILSLSALVVTVRALALVRPGSRYAERLVGHDLAFRCLGRLRVAVYERIEPLAPAGLQQFRDGELLAGVVADIDELQDLLLRLLLPVAIALPAALLVVAVTAAIHPGAAVALAAGLLATATIPPAVAHRTTSQSRAAQGATRAALTADLVDTLGAAEELWLAGADGDARRRCEAGDAALVAAARRDAQGAGLADGLGAVLSGLTAAAVLVIGSRAAHAGRLDPLLVAPLTLMSIGAFEAVLPLSPAARHLSSIRSAAGRVQAMFADGDAVADPTEPVAAPGHRPPIDLAGVAVDRGDRVVLRGLDLALAPGERIVISGPSGGGKSTLLQLLVRFVERSGGTARLDGSDLADYLQEDVRREVLLLDQDAHVFTSDIRQNVALARPGATDSDVLAALDRAQLGAWTRSLPDGLDTRVGAGGRPLSGGERQRLAIARAFLADPSVLLLDEPSANLDGGNVAALLADLWAAAGERSVVLVTHGDVGPFAAARPLTLRDGLLR